MYRIPGRTGGPARIAILLIALAYSAAMQTNAIAACNSVDMNGQKLYVTDDVLRQAALAVADAKVRAAQALTTVDPPAGATRCTGVDPRIPDTGPTRANCYGNVTSKLKFLRLAARVCMGLNQPSQYFSPKKPQQQRDSRRSKAAQRHFLPAVRPTNGTHHD